MNFEKPSLDFCILNINLSWEDVVWAVEHQIFSWIDAYEFAQCRLNDVNSVTFAIEANIAQLTKNNASEIMDLARSAIINSAFDESLLKRRWLYLLLRWLYENRASIEDIFEKVAYLYAEFDYEQSMEDFVYYLPSKDNWNSNAHTITENENWMLSKWKCFLENEQLLIKNLA